MLSCQLYTIRTVLKFKQNKKKITLLQYISGYLLSIWVAFCEVQGQEIVANAKKVAWPTIVFKNDLYYLGNSLFPRPTSEGLLVLRNNCTQLPTVKYCYHQKHNIKIIFGYNVIFVNSPSFPIVIKCYNFRPHQNP